MHLRAAQALFVGVFAGGHLDQRRAAEKDLGLATDENVVVAHAWLIGAAGGRCTEDHRDGRDAQLGQLGDLVEQAPRLGEMIGLAPDRCLGVAAGIAAKIGAGRFHELHIGHAVDARDLEAPHQLLGIEGIEGTRPHRGVVPEDDAFDAFDHTDADHKARADIELRAPGRQRADLEKGRIGVEDHRNTLAQRQLAAGPQALHRVFAAAGGDFIVQGVELPQGFEHLGAVLREPLAFQIECGLEDRHERDSAGRLEVKTRVKGGGVTGLRGRRLS